MADPPLEVLYCEAGSISALARLLGVPFSTARSRLVKAGIPTRSSGYRSPKSVVRSGPDHPNWKGGTYRQSEGYVYEYAPAHPAAVKGYVLQHRLVIERELDRFLTANEVVHHRNEVKDDNRLENLELIQRGAHASHHKMTFPRDAGGRFRVPT